MLAVFEATSVGSFMLAVFEATSVGSFVLERRRRLWHLLGSCRTVAAHILHALDYFQIKIAR